MSRQPLPEDVIVFIDEHLESVPHLEALLLIADSAPRAWRVEEVAARVYVPSEQASAILVDLERARLIVAAADAAGAAYQFASDEVLRALVGRIASAYRRQLVQVADLIHSKAPRPVRAFAHAFKFKKDS